MQSGPWFAYRKTFLAGEYTACLYGRGLVITYGPPFELKQSTKMNLSAFAQTVIDQYPNIPTALTLSDSKPTHGGVGASSAELACLYQYLCDIGLETMSTLPKQRQWYRQQAWQGQGLPPSGIDFIAQRHQGLMWVDCDQNTCQTMDWPFDDYVWLVIKTNDKLNTHTHLESIQKKSDFKALNGLLDPIKGAIESTDFEGFVQAQSQFDRALHELGFKTQTHQPYLDAIMKLSDVAYIRGSGAMGQDTWLTLIKKSTQTETLKAIQAIYPITSFYTIDASSHDRN